MNHFFALELSEAARQEGEKIAEAWQEQLLPEQKAKWIDLEDYHLTLHFLGDLPEEAQADLIAAAVPIAMATEPFELQLAATGTFPHPRSPRVLWLGVQTSPPLLNLVIRLRDAVETLGYPPEQRPYRPHITLARCRPGRAEEAWPLPNEQAFAKWTVARFSLMQTSLPESCANDGKGRYNSVHTFPFGDTHSSHTSPKRQGEMIG